MLTATEAQKRQLRKIRLSSPITDEVRTVVKSGIVTSGLSGAYIQFGADVELYGLWEAILYVETYEPEHYKPGTAQQALQKAISLLPA